MLLTALLLTLAAVPGAPTRPDLFAAHLLPREQVLGPTLGARGHETYVGVRQVVTGSILTALGGGFGALGAYGLLSAIPQTGSTRTVLTALGWTSLGVGVVLGAVGIPLLIVGIVKLSRRGVALSVSQTGNLAVAF